MNLHSIASSVIGSVNPLIPLTIKVSTGPVTNPDGSRTPGYASPVTVMGQVQSLTYTDLTQIDGLNIQGVRRAIYINGEVDGLVRSENKGGDLITTPNGEIWLVVLVLEYWPDWTKCVVTLQNGS